MQILLVAGGDPAYWPSFDSADYDRFVGIDRGNLFLLERGITPDIAVGDFDSLSEKERVLVFEQAGDVSRSPAEKDDTDTQLALEKTFRHYPDGRITIIGATGGRLDHLLANIWLPLEPRFYSRMKQIVLKDNTNTVSYLSKGVHQVKKEKGMTYLGYCCLTPVSGLTLKQVKYPLENVEIRYPTSLASNEFLTEQAEISFTNGVIAVIQSKD
ncbi:thiamine pyrophosphokinase [Enterococcus florum]|uniref:Thiamine diphosphokinase n=1 Tax=Enterococcus florum TaxID=2480627 RepID=A0A4P5PHA0_9ENTE|nr:thiamine diphosphokinase [Enterococcus florum]GCF95801.1 thiamine pyrophosphokinase [Enterococcus florum]